MTDQQQLAPPATTTRRWYLSPAMFGGAMVLVVAAAIGSWLLERRAPRPPTEIDANCSVLPGEQVTSQAIRIRCGLDDAHVQSAVTQALSRVNVGDLIEQARKGQLADQAAVRDLAGRLGLGADKVSEALRRLAAQAASDALPAARLAAVILRDTPVEGVVAVGSAAPDPGPGATRAEVRQQELAQEVSRLIANCTAINGDKVKADIDIHCGPSETDIQHLISQVLAQTDPAGLVKLAMQGGDPNAPQIAALASRLGLTNATVAQLLAKMGQAPESNGAFAQQFAALARQHMNTVLLASSLPTGNPAIEALREQALAAVGQGDGKRAELLLAAAELAQRSIAMQTPSALTLAAQADDRGKELARNHDYAGASTLFASAVAQVPDDLPLLRAAYLIDQAKAAGGATDKDVAAQASPLYHRAFESVAQSFAVLCDAGAAVGISTYEATFPDRTARLNCRQRQ
jgi:hypothetical protein